MYIFLAWKANICQPGAKLREERTETPPWVRNAGEKPSAQKCRSGRHHCFKRNGSTSFFGKHKAICLVRNKIFSLMDVIARTIFLFAFQPRATLRLPWARLSWPFRPFLLSLLIIISVIIYVGRINSIAIIRTGSAFFWPERPISVSPG